MNGGLTAVNLSGWKLCSLVGDKQEFNFPEDTILEPGCSTTVWSGKESDKKENSPYSLFWTKKNMWNDRGDKAVLVDPEGNTIDEQEEKPPKDLQVDIQTLDLIRDYVTVINRGTKEVDMSGWILKSLIGSQFFVYPEGK